MSSPLNLEVGLSSSISSAAQGGDAVTGEFKVGGKNSLPEWLWLVLLLAVLWFFLFRRKGRR